MRRWAGSDVLDRVDAQKFPAVAALALLGLILLARAATGQQAEKTAREVERLAKAEIAQGVASVSVVLVHRDNVPWRGAFGVANAWSATRATTETVYSTASTLKPVLATAVLRLAASGALELDAPVDRYLEEGSLPAHPDSDTPITLRHLLAHTSGLPGSAATTPLWDRSLPQPLPDLVAELAPVDPPETRHRYSNPAYSVAGLVIERVSGKKLEDLLLRDIFGPLGYEHNALFGLTPKMVERLALPYLPFAIAERLGLDPEGEPGKPVPMPQVRFAVYPAGDAYVTPLAMGQFLGAHLNGGSWQGATILEPSYAIEARTRQEAVGSEHGLGWFLVEREGRTFVEHSGGYLGYSAYLIGDPESGYGAYLTANAMGDMTDLAVAVMTSLLEENGVADGDLVGGGSSRRPPEPPEPPHDR